MKKRYSRLARTEDKRNIRRAFLYMFFTFLILFGFFIFGLPSVAKFAAFLTELRQSSEPVESSDTTPPVPPRFEPIDEYTNDTNIELVGSTEPGAAVIIYYNNKDDEILANSSGKFTITIPLRDGTNSISAVSKDSSGNESQETDVIKVTYDNDPPPLEITKPQDGSEYYGSKQRQVIIEGTSEEGVGININDRLVIVENDGTFSYLASLSEGENTFNVKAEDGAGNTTEATLILKFTP